MTADHRASDPAESRRIRSLGGEIHAAVSTDDSARVAGELEVTRSFGDAALKYCIKADPDYQEHSLATDGDEFLILATDGVWDVVSDATAVRSGPVAPPPGLAPAARSAHRGFVGAPDAQGEARV